MMPRPRSIAVIIPAGGSGTRMGTELPKQFLPLRGTPILLRTLRAFDTHPAVAEIVVVGPSAHLARIASMVQRAGLKRISALVAGGRDRQASVWQGLCAVASDLRDVLVHDAVRPLVERKLISAVVEAVDRWGAAIAAVPARETILWEGKAGTFTRSLDRSRLWTVQTPQGFRRELLMEAHRRAERSRYRGTDEASLVLRMGKPVHIVPSTPLNMKITSPEDLAIATVLLGSKNR